MREPDLAERIVASVVRAVDLPVTVKMRLGFAAGSLDAPELARRCEAVGASLVSVHGRTRAQFYEGRADWTAVRLGEGRRLHPAHRQWGHRFARGRQTGASPFASGRGDGRTRRARTSLASGRDRSGALGRGGAVACRSASDAKSRSSIIAACFIFMASRSACAMRASICKPMRPMRSRRALVRVLWRSPLPWCAPRSPRRSSGSCARSSISRASSKTLMRLILRLISRWPHESRERKPRADALCPHLAAGRGASDPQCGSHAHPLPFG